MDIFIDAAHDIARRRRSLSLSTLCVLYTCIRYGIMWDIWKRDGLWFSLYGRVTRRAARDSASDILAALFRLMLYVCLYIYIYTVFMIRWSAGLWRSHENWDKPSDSWRGDEACRGELYLDCSLYISMKLRKSAAAYRARLLCKRARGVAYRRYSGNFISCVMDVRWNLARHRRCRVIVKFYFGFVWKYVKARRVRVYTEEKKTVGVYMSIITVINSNTRLYTVRDKRATTRVYFFIIYFSVTPRFWKFSEKEAITRARLIPAAR